VVRGRVLGRSTEGLKDGKELAGGSVKKGSRDRAWQRDSNVLKQQRSCGHQGQSGSGSKAVLRANGQRTDGWMGG